MKHFFINIGGKERLRHRPIDQFNGRATRRQVGAYLSVRQRKLHKTLSETLLQLRQSEIRSNMEAPAEVMEEEGYSSDEENPDVVVPPIQKEVWKEDFITVKAESSQTLQSCLMAIMSSQRAS